MILVAGATGRLGGAIARGLLARGMPVRALVRGGSDAGTLAGDGAQIALGDLRDPASLAEACRGVDTVITTANSARRTGADTIEAVDLDGTRSLIDAAAAAGVRRFVYTSVLGATANHPAPFMAAKGANDAHLQKSGMTWTVLAPNAFQESWPAVVVGGPALSGHPVTIVGEGRRRHTFVAEADVAAFALAALANPAAANRSIPIGGPEALSWRDVVRIYEQVLGRTLEVRFVPPGEPVPGIPPAVVPFLAALDSYDTEFDARAVAAEFGVRLTPLEETARSQAAAGGPSH
jgi:NADH dehydrogenase